MGWPGVGFAGVVAAGVAGAAGLAATGGAGSAVAAGGTGPFEVGGTAPVACCAWAGGGATTTAGGAAGFSGFSAAGGGGGGATIGGAWRGAGTTTGRSTGGAAGLATGFSAAGGAAGGAAAAGGACGLAGAAVGAFVTVAGRGGGAGGRSISCCRSRSSRITSPGLEILERSIFGLISPAAGLSLEGAPDLAEKCFLILSASSGSTELECVFFSVMPTSSRTSRMALLFTSSSLARSLIRIFIRPLVSSRLFPLRDHIDLTALIVCTTVLLGFLFA